MSVHTCGTSPPRACAHRGRSGADADRRRPAPRVSAPPALARRRLEIPVELDPKEPRGTPGPLHCPAMGPVE
jgi:hypothetical protein